MRKHKLTAAIIGSIAAASAIAACGGGSGAEAGADSGTAGTSNRGLPQGSEPSNLDPADFSTNIDNPYWPMRPGNKWVYSETDTQGTKQKVVVTVTKKTKKIANA